MVVSLLRMPVMNAYHKGFYAWVIYAVVAELVDAQR